GRRHGEAGDRFGRAARGDRRGPRPAGVAERVRQDHRDAVSDPGGGSRDGADKTGEKRKRRKRDRRKLSHSSVARLDAQRVKKARRAARQQRRTSLLGRIGRSDFVERRLAGGMRFVFAWSRSVGRPAASRTAARVTRTLSRFSSENALAAANLAAAY